MRESSVSSSTSNKIIPIDAPIHLVWLGSALPNSTRFPYRKTVKRFCELNPTREVALWHAPKFLDEKEKSKMKQTLKGLPENFVLKDVEELSRSTNKKIRDSYEDICRYSKSHFGLGSDVLTVITLHGKGGFYFDIDSIPVATIPEVEAPYGFLANLTFKPSNLKSLVQKGTIGELREKQMNSKYWKYHEILALLHEASIRVLMDFDLSNFLAVPPNSSLIDKLLEEEKVAYDYKIIEDYLSAQGIELDNHEPLDPEFRRLIDDISLPFFYTKHNGMKVKCVQLLDQMIATYKINMIKAELTAKKITATTDQANKEMTKAFGKDFVSAAYKSYDRMDDVLFSYKGQDLGTPNARNVAFVEIAFNPKYPLEKEQFGEFVNLFQGSENLKSVEESDTYDRFRFQATDVDKFQAHIEALDFEDLAKRMSITPAMVASRLSTVGTKPISEEVKHLQGTLRNYCKDERVNVAQPKKDDIVISLTGEFTESEKEKILSDISDLFESLDQQSEEYLNKAPNYLQLYKLQPENIETTARTIQSLIHHQEKYKTRTKPEKELDSTEHSEPKLKNPSRSTSKGISPRRRSRHRERHRDTHSPSPSLSNRTRRLPRRSSSLQTRRERSRTKSKNSLSR